MIYKAGAISPAFCAELDSMFVSPGYMSCSNAINHRFQFRFSRAGVDSNEPGEQAGLVLRGKLAPSFARKTQIGFDADSGQQLWSGTASSETCISLVDLPLDGLMIVSPKDSHSFISFLLKRMRIRYLTIYMAVTAALISSFPGSIGVLPALPSNEAVSLGTGTAIRFSSVMDNG